MLKIKPTILMDCYRLTGKTGYRSFIHVFFKNPSFRFILIKRLIIYLNKYNPIRYILLLYYKRLKIKFGFQIPPLTKIGEGFVINHFGNIIINQGAVIGDNCSISQGVTIGKVDRGKLVGNPTIGKRV